MPSLPDESTTDVRFEIPARAPDFQLTLTRALLESLELRRILYVILSGITAGDGLNLNRAFLLLEDEGGRMLSGQLAIGPESDAEAHRIWTAMTAERFTLRTVMEQYDQWNRDGRAAALSTQFQRVQLPLPLPEAPPEPCLALLAAALREQAPRVVNAQELAVPGAPDLVLFQAAVVPLVLAERTIGLILVDNRYNERPIDPAELDDLSTLANLAAVAVERARLHERIRAMAERDGLTGLFNRRRFDELLPQLVAESRQHGDALALLLIDIDHFKPINDRFGHLVGDDLLRGVAGILQARLRVGDFPCRYGGDEMAVLLPHTGVAAASALAERLRALMAQARFGEAGEVQTTVSMGLAGLAARHGPASDLLAAADQALYAAKRSGKNRVATAGT
jgi:diguanylate cyclase (GGDEF)-like protein